MVWGKGKLDSGIAIIGEAPGKNEDREGVPFIGKAGEILDEALETAGLRYGDNANCVILNAMACRPCNQNLGPNRAPSSGEIENCRLRLSRVLEHAKPSLVVMLGNVATESVCGYAAVPKILSVDGITVLKTFHPMAIVYARERTQAWMKFWSETLPPYITKHSGKRIYPKWSKLPLLKFGEIRDGA